MTNDLPFERWPTSAKAVIESATAGDPDSVQRKIRHESMRAFERERAEQLWLPRLYRKIPRRRRPEPWRQLRSEYTKRWCESTGASPECDWDPDPSRVGSGGLIPDLDAIRCIVFGWADGSDPEALQRWVTRWRDEIVPARQCLEPVRNSSAPGPLLYAYVTEELPAMRARLGQIIDSWPDSPLAVQGLLRDFRPAVERLRPVQDLVSKLREFSAPDPAKDELEDQGRGIADPLELITRSDDIAAVERLAASQAKLAALISDAERHLEEDWEIAADGKLKQRRHGRPGRKSNYLTRTTLGLYDYLRPIYLRTFGDHRTNPEPLRCHISLFLSPYFHLSEIGTEPRAPIWQAIKNHRS